MKLLTNVLLTMVLLVSIVNAEEVPKGNDFDNRIRTSVYNPDQVYRVSARIGYASYLQFWEGEKLESYFTGDESGWDIGSHDSVVALKPLVRNPTTNFIIVTNKGRVYNLIFDLKGKTAKNHVIGLRFKYPEEERELNAQKKLEERDEYLAKKKTQKEEELKAERLLAREYEFKQESAKAKAEKKAKLDRLESDLRRRALKKEKNEEALALLSLQEQFFSFDQEKKKAAYNDRKRQRDEAMQIARQEQEALDRAEARQEAKRLRNKRLKLEAEEDAERLREKAEAALIRQEKKLVLAKKKAALSPNHQPYKNYKYVAAGTGDLRPVEMFDNGRFTFIRFSEHIQLPAVFRVRNGKETLVNSSMKEGWMVIQNLSNEWKVRLDDEFICIKKSGRA